MRAFVAVPLPADFEEWLQEYRSSLGEFAPRTVPASSCHMTLRFLGEMSENDMHAAGRLLETDLTECAVISMCLDTIGVFLKNGKPSVLWLGPSHKTEEVVNLAVRVRKVLYGFGTGRQEDSFTPHITLARFSSRGTPADAAVLRNRLPKPFTFVMDQVVLYESVLGQGHPLYLPHGTVFLRRFAE